MSVRSSVRRGAAVGGSGHPGDVEAGRDPGAGVFVASDVLYLASGGAQAAAVVAADAALCHLAADRISVVSGVEPYRPPGLDRPADVGPRQGSTEASVCPALVTVTAARLGAGIALIPRHLWDDA